MTTPHQRRPSEAAMGAWQAILHAHRRLVIRLDDDLRREHDMSLEWYDVLFQLHDAGGGLRMHQLAERVLISRYNCTRLVDRLARAGLVIRETATDDRRGTHAVLTNQGRRAFRLAAGTHLDGLTRYVEQPLSTRQLTQIADALGQISAALREPVSGSTASRGAL